MNSHAQPSSTKIKLKAKRKQFSPKNKRKWALTKTLYKFIFRFCLFTVWLNVRNWFLYFIRFFVSALTKVKSLCCCSLSLFQRTAIDIERKLSCKCGTEWVHDEYLYRKYCLNETDTRHTTRSTAHTTRNNDVFYFSVAACILVWDFASTVVYSVYLEIFASMQSNSNNMNGIVTTSNLRTRAHSLIHAVAHPHTFKQKIVQQRNNVVVNGVKRWEHNALPFESADEWTKRKTHN